MNSENKQIYISNITNENDRINISLIINGNNEHVFVDYKGIDSNSTVTDRIDAIVIGLSLFAIKNGYDFVSDIPISEGLNYNLKHLLYPSLSYPNLYQPKIEAPACQEISENKGHVATGISCGVDSLYTIETHTAGDIPLSHKITDLVFLNVGSHKVCDGKQQNDELFNGRRKICMDYAAEKGLNVIEITSNLPLILDKYDNGYSHVENHTYMSAFCITWLQSYLIRYYYSSGYPFRDFHINEIGTRDFDSAFYDLLTLKCFSHGNLAFESCGGEIGRLEKVRLISQNPINCKYLNVCVAKPYNDGVCFKCSRTLLEIEAIGALDKYREAFDIDKYLETRKTHIASLIIQNHLKDPYALEIYPYFKNQISIALKTRVLTLFWIRTKMSNLKNIIKNFIGKE